MFVTLSRIVLILGLVIFLFKSGMMQVLTDYFYGRDTENIKENEYDETL